MLHSPANVILVNCTVLTMNPAQPLAGAVALRGEQILAVGEERAVLGCRTSRTRLIDCQGLTLIPGLVDAHCHLLATASTLTGLDCSPGGINSIAQLQSLLTQRAARTASGRWLRGFGLDPDSLAEKRFPTRRELDLVSQSHPVRLEHSSGHGAVLNSLALQLAGIGNDTPDPVDGVIGRDTHTGEPNGLLLEMAGYLRARLGNTRNPDETGEGIDRLNRLLLRCGITSVQDAGPANNLSRWNTFCDLTNNNRFIPRVTMLAGGRYVRQMVDSGLQFGAGDDRLRLGHAKIMLTHTTGALQPDLDELYELVQECQASGFPVAIHAIEKEAVAAAANCLLRLKSNKPGRVVEETGSVSLAPDRRHRIEHCAEVPPRLLELVRRSGAMVVTQPGFIFWRGDRYLERVASRLLPHLYPVAALAGAGVPQAFSSDSPVSPLSPWPAVYAATARRTAGGAPFPVADSGSAGLSVTQALKFYTRCGAWAEGTENRKGAIRPGMLADLTLVELEPAAKDPEKVKDARVHLTVVGGEIAWADGVGD